MKSLVNKKGFTLIELLAVIVVLAIIMMIATTQVIPLITDSRMGGFASTANTVLSTVETVVLSDEIKGNTSKTCYTVKELIEDDYLDKITGADTAKTSGYAGYVVVDKSAASTGGEYVYKLYLADYTNKYFLNGYVYGGPNSYGLVVADEIPTSDTSGKGVYTSEPTTFSDECPSSN